MSGHIAGLGIVPSAKGHRTSAARRRSALAAVAIHGLTWLRTLQQGTGYKEATLLISFEEFGRVVFERGVALTKLADGSWQCDSAQGDIRFSALSCVATRLKLRPIVAIGATGTPLEPLTALLPARSGRLLNVQVSELEQDISRINAGRDWLRARSQLYTLRAVLYSLKQLAMWYADTCREFKESMANHITGDRCTFAPDEPYFEFEALVTNAIRSYDALRYPIWRAYGSGGSTPRSFGRTLRSGTLLPSDLGDRLCQTRDRHYSPAKEYRDCIQHYVSVSSSSWAMMERLEGACWSVIVRIPDNPQERSPDRFQFVGDMDALTYSWVLATELVEVTRAVVHGIVAC